MFRLTREVCSCNTYTLIRRPLAPAQRNPVQERQRGSEGACGRVVLCGLRFQGVYGLLWRAPIRV